MHNYNGETSYNLGHSHSYDDETSTVPSGVFYVYYIDGYTVRNDEHHHYYLIQTLIGLFFYKSHGSF